MIDLYSVGFNECPDTLNSKPTKIPTSPPYHCALYCVFGWKTIATQTIVIHTIADKQLSPHTIATHTIVTHTIVTHTQMSPNETEMTQNDPKCAQMSLNELK